MKPNKNNKMARPQKPVANKGPKLVPATLNDLFLTLVDGVLTSTLSPETQWAGIQRFTTLGSVDGAEAIFEAQRNYTTPPGAGATTSCSLHGTGFYRAFASDFDYDIHLSNIIFVP